MNRPLYYYAKLNENDICYGFETLAKKLREEETPSNLVRLVDYNETYLWKKYDRDLKAFGQETYQPSIDTNMQDTVERLEVDNINLTNEVTNLNSNVVMLEGTINELMIILGGMQ